MRKLLFLGALSVAGCSFTVRGLPISDDASPMIDAGPEASPGCDPGGADNRCSDDQGGILICRADGTGFNPATPCVFGCAGATGSPHCGAFAPSGAALPGDYGQTGLTALMLTADTVFHVDDGSVTGGGSRPAGGGVKNGIFYREAAQTNGPKVAVFAFGGLVVASGVNVSFVGRDAVALVSSKDVTIAGVISAVPDCSKLAGGPGGGGGGSESDPSSGNAVGVGGGKAGGFSNPWSAGGGGGGFGDHGGIGGGGNGAVGGPAGMIFGDLTATPMILVGGGGGGAGGHNSKMLDGAGGGGGGAVQISVAGMLTIAATGVVDASGCGGFGGGAAGGGGGGASGGAIVLEGAHITLENGAVLGVNGGGGGGGDGGNPGNPGSAVSSGSGKGGSTSGSGTGGNDGGLKGATVGKDGPPNGGANKNAGGAGGGVGRIALKTLNASGLSDLGASYSPDPSDRNGAGARMTTFGAAVFQ